MLYVFDTSSIRVFENYYPSHFPSFWTGFDQLVSNGGVISVREVRNELDYQITTPWLRDWIDNHKAMFVTPTPADTDFVRNIFTVNRFQALVGQKQRLKGMPVADPWVVACAAITNGCVVTQETLKPNAARIPNVCEHFGVACADLERFLAEQKWKF